MRGAGSDAEQADVDERVRLRGKPHRADPGGHVQVVSGVEPRPAGFVQGQPGGGMNKD